jgi:hypothetical protein
VIVEEDLASVAAATATERPDVAIVVVGEGNSESLAGIGTIVHEAACPVIAVLDLGPSVHQGGGQAGDLRSHHQR